MSLFAPFQLDKSKLAGELAAFESLLTPPTRELKERDEILPFFAANLNLASLMLSYSSDLRRPSLIKTELHLFGAHACDLAVGHPDGQFCFVEFENAGAGCVFRAAKPVRAGHKARPGKVTPTWAPRFEHGFSQIVDWFYLLDDQKQSKKFRTHFGGELADYVGVLVIGRDAHLTADMQDRLRWRSQHTRVNGKAVICMTFDGLFRGLRERVEYLT